MSALKTRLIPVLLLQNGLLVRSEKFSIHQVIGNPFYEAKRFNEWNVDELIYLDISSSDDYDLRRNDHKTKGLSDPLDILDMVSKTCFMPLTWGGRIRTIKDVRDRISRGADKITLNTAALERPEFITEVAKAFGSQAVVLSMDVYRHEDGRAEVFSGGGENPTGKDPAKWASEIEGRGAGEVLLQSVQRDGAGTGYDLDLISEVASATTIPIIACSGIGMYEQYSKGIKAGASAAAAANIFHFKELSDRGGKRAMARARINVRI